LSPAIFQASGVSSLTTWAPELLPDENVETVEMYEIVSGDTQGGVARRF